MQEEYFQLMGRRIAQSKGERYFDALVKYIDADRLRKSFKFLAIKQAVMSWLPIQNAFDNIAVWAVHHDKKSAIEFLIEDCGFADLVRQTDLVTHNTLLHEACIYGAIETATYLLERGANPNSVNKNELTPLHMLMVARKYMPFVAKLKKYGANLNLIDVQGFAPIHTAAVHQNKAAIRELLENNADTNLLYCGRTYLTLLKDVSEGRLSVQSLVSWAEDENELEKLKVEVCFNFLAKRRNISIFHKYIKQVLAKDYVVTQEEALLLMDAYFTVTSTDPDQIIKFLNKNYRSHRLTVDHLVTMIVRISYFLMDQNKSNSMLALCRFVVGLLNQEETKSVRSAELYNVIAATLNRAAFYQYTEEVARRGLASLPEGDQSLVKCHLLYNFGISKQYRFFDAEPELSEAFSLCKDDIDIFQEYIRLLVYSNKYKRAIKICRESNCGEFSRLNILRIKLLLGEINPEQLLERLSEEYEDINTQILSLDLKAHCYMSLGDVTHALHCNKLSYALSEKMSEDNEQRRMNQAISKRLMMYNKCHQFEEGIIFLQQAISKYSDAFLYDSTLILNAAIIFVANNHITEALNLINLLKDINFNRRKLADFYVLLAFDAIKNDESDFEKSAKFFSLALIIDPSDMELKVYEFLLAILQGDQEKFSKIKNEIDHSFVTAISQKNDLFLKETLNEELTLEEYDPVKIHHYFQQQKQQVLFNLLQDLEPRPVTKWVTEKFSYSDTDEDLVDLDSKFYPNYFAIIDPKLNLDHETRKRCQIALMKGFCQRNQQKNGLKVINNCVIELKIDGDIRLIATSVFRNPKNKYLILLSQIADHKSIKLILRKNKPIQIIEVSDQEQLSNSDFPGTFLGRISGPIRDVVSRVQNKEGIAYNT